MLYTRSDASGTRFEPERDIVHSRYGLDGGGTVAADDAGNVSILWHAPGDGPRTEGNRRVWLARSSDDGATFAAEIAPIETPTGACACCGMRALATGDGGLAILYRSAREVVNRDMYLALSRGGGERFDLHRIEPWTVGKCVMSTCALARGSSGIVAAWETRGQISWAPIAALARADRGATNWPATPLGGKGVRRRHPAIAVNGRGEVLLVWTEGMGWNRGGDLAWQLFDSEGRPIADADASGRAEGVPVWSLVAVFARDDGGFTILY